LDRILEIAEYYTNEQKYIIKFRTDNYQKLGFNSIHNRQPTPFVQCYQNISSSTASPSKSPTSPEYSPVTKESTDSSSTSSDDSTHDFDDDSTSSSSDDDSSPRMRSALDKVLDL
jgi:hypothetical protein